MSREERAGQIVDTVFDRVFSKYKFRSLELLVDNIDGAETELVEELGKQSTIKRLSTILPLERLRNALRERPEEAKRDIITEYTKLSNDAELLGGNDANGNSSLLYELRRYDCKGLNYDFHGYYVNLEYYLSCGLKKRIERMIEEKPKDSNARIAKKIELYVDQFVDDVIRQKGLYGIGALTVHTPPVRQFILEFCSNYVRRHAFG